MMTVMKGDTAVGTHGRRAAADTAVILSCLRGDGRMVGEDSDYPSMTGRRSWRCRERSSFEYSIR
jgi:hypothetical protein